MSNPPPNTNPPDHRDAAEPRPHLVCPQCASEYTPAHPTTGRRVRCYHCGHVWRDDKRSMIHIAGALNQAASAWSELGSTMIGAADHASTMGHLVSKSLKAPRPPVGEWIGRTLGRYEIKAVLGQGAMGYVYEAYDADLKRTVALKIMPRRTESKKTSLAVRMFLQEAQIAANLQHPNIVTIYEVGNENGIHFFAMECVRGSTLLALIKDRGPLPANQACFVIAHAARALAAGHAVGVVHRDVKPGNIMIDTSGNVKVTDFGLADVSGLEGISELSQRALGTPGWISPEVAREEKATPASDIYSLGLSLYYTLTGRRLIRAKTRSGMVRKQREAQSVRRADLPEGWPRRLRDCVVQCLQADPADRYQSAETLATDLLRAVVHDESDATMTLEHHIPPKAPRRANFTIVWMILSVLLVASLLIAGWYLF